MAPGSGQACANTTATPDVRMIETALACGTVERDIFCAGLFEYRATVAYSRRRIHEGMGMGCSRVRESPCRLAGLAFRTKRTTASEPANNGPRFTPMLLMTTAETIHDETASGCRRPGLGGLCPPGPPRFIAFGQPRSGNKRSGAYCAPPPVLAPGAALGSRLRVALSSDRATIHHTRTHPAKTAGPHAMRTFIPK